MKNLPKIHCRHLLLFFFHQSKGKISAFAATKKIRDQKKRAKDGSKDLRKEILILKINNAVEGREHSVLKILFQESRRIQKPTPESWLLLSNAHQ